MEFEFDRRKSESNQRKHGIDFIETQLLWEDSNLLEIPARTEDDPRFLVIGQIRQKHWSGIITYRKGRVRIMSVRSSRRKEIEIYES